MGWGEGGAIKEEECMEEAGCGEEKARPEPGFLVSQKVFSTVVSPRCEACSLSQVQPADSLDVVCTLPARWPVIDVMAMDGARFFCRV